MNEHKVHEQQYGVSVCIKELSLLWKQGIQYNGSTTLSRRVHLRLNSFSIMGTGILDAEASLSKCHLGTQGGIDRNQQGYERVDTSWRVTEVASRRGSRLWGCGYV